MRKNILFRCDASKEIGLGHITRCLVLANQFRDNGEKVFFAIKNYEIAKEKIKEQNFDILIADEINFDYFEWIRNIVEEKEINIFVGDVRDGFPIELIPFMKNKNILTIAIDEPSEYAKECDLCFYPPHAMIDKAKYKGKVYQGLEYVILRPEFYKKYEKKKNIIPNILVMMGGTDTHNLTLDVLKILEKKESNFNISVVLARRNENYSDIESLKRVSTKNINISFNIKNMSFFLNDVDFAIITFGMSAYELLYKNIRSIHICLGADHIKSSKFFNVNNYAKSIEKKFLIIDDNFLKEEMLDFSIISNKIINKIIKGC